MSFQMPPQKNNADGEPRKVGLELEFTGIELPVAARLLQSLYGGAIHEEHRYHIKVTDTELGDFDVELDARILRKMARQNFFEQMGLDLDEDTIQKSIEDVVDKLAKTVVPLEIVMPPVLISELDRLEELRKSLQKNKAEGTKGSLVHAFGMHMNIEMPDLKTNTLRDYLRSFLIVYPWLLLRLDIDITRRISPFIDPFPDKYVQRVLNPAYNPDLDELIGDYLEFNPTRNRPLDMMPIFGLLNGKMIEEVMKGKKNSPRPALHYRLPNSHVDDPAWQFEDEWNCWLVVEKLAEDKEMLYKLSRLYLVRKQETVLAFRKEWAQIITILLDLDEV